MSGSTTLALTAAALAGGGATPAAAAPSVEVMVVGRSSVLAEAATVRAAATKVTVGSRRCAVGAGTPLAALAGLRSTGGPAFRMVDYQACSSRARDASGLFVNQIAAERNRGTDGWVYKVGTKVGTAAAADVNGPFGTGRVVRPGQRVLWFWCRTAKTGGCQRTLTVSAPRTAALGAPIDLMVRGYDDRGRATPVAGATVRVGAVSVVSGAGGRAVVPAPPEAGPVAVGAERAGMVPAFPETLVVG